MKKRAGIGMVVAGFISLSTIAGCAATDSSKSSDEILRIASPSAVEAPLNKYVQTPQEDSIILKARSILAGHCVQRYGLPRQGELTDPVTAMVRNPVPLYLSERGAATYGYRAPAQGSSAPSGSGDDAKRPLSAHKRRTIDAIMNGWANTPKENALHSYRGRTVSRTGCIGESDARLMTNTTRPRINGGQRVTSSTQILNLLLALKSEASDKTQADPRYRSMIRSWASCMRRAGHDYATPADTQNAATHMPPTVSGGPSRAERRLAQQDASCQREVNYLGVVGRLTEIYQGKVVTEYRDTLTAVRKNIDERVAAAKKITEGDAA
ncbi:hypothetical protein [Streptomyces sp. NPDC001675]